MTMSAEVISDQKRRVRAEFWLAARARLRARDRVHHRAWRVLMIAGPAPAEEINCIRECMHQAHITAVDIDEDNIMRAIDAGADDAFVCDVGRVEHVHNAAGTYQKAMPPPELAEKKFDIVSLDLTGPADDWLAGVVGCYYRQAVTSKGAMMVTFSYGRDVVEWLTEQWNILEWKAERKMGGGSAYYPGYRDAFNALQKELPEPIAMRVWAALRLRCNELHYCMQYVGNRMPMVACFIAKGDPIRWAEYTALEPDDLQHALVVSEQLNLANLYATPVERIDAFRAAYTRKLAAHKAVATKRQHQLETVPVPSLEDAWQAASNEERAAWWDKYAKPALRNYLIKNGWTPPASKALPLPTTPQLEGKRNGRTQPD